MFTQVTFGDFLFGLTQQTEIEFKEYPNVAISWNDGDWGYQILNSMSVRVFRYGLQGGEIKLEGPRWNDTRETRESFQPRFETAFRAAITTLQ